MTTETCPNCGADEDDSIFWTGFYKCGAAFKSERTSTCYERQLAAKDAEIERLKQAVLDEREACIKVIKDCSFIWWDWPQFAYKTEAEIRARGEVK